MHSESAAIELLQYMREDLEKPLPPGSSQEEISAQAYRDWAMNEALARILDKPFEDAILVLENFMTELLVYFSITSDHDLAVNPFGIAFEQIETVLAMLQYPTED